MLQTFDIWLLFPKAVLRKCSKKKLFLKCWKTNLNFETGSTKYYCCLKSSTTPHINPIKSTEQPTKLAQRFSAVKILPPPSFSSWWTIYLKTQTFLYLSIQKARFKLTWHFHKTANYYICERSFSESYVNCVRRLSFILVKRDYPCNIILC